MNQAAEDEAGLFKAVVSQALVDATLDIPDPYPLLNCRQRKDEDDMVFLNRRQKATNTQINDLSRPRREARNWFLGKSRDFCLITSMAGYDPEDVHERAIKLAELGWPAPGNPAETGWNAVIKLAEKLAA